MRSSATSTPPLPADRSLRSLLPALHRWYRRSSRPLPWRRTRDPYRILISEVMLQQTQVRRVLEKYPAFLRTFPTLTSLGRATAGDVLRAWRGMGYNNRAIRLHSFARTVLREHRGRIPRDPAVLVRLPGIGPYTANAVSCFAFGQPVPLVDTNIARVITRFYRGKKVDPWRVAAAELPLRAAYTWNQALMELGALICTSANPRCSACPLRSRCRSAYRPVTRPRSARKPERSRHGTPDRIHRGRIIECLRDLPAGSALVTRLARLAIHDYRTSDRQWLTRILGRLERDGLIRMTKRGKSEAVTLAP